jgi:hypothetical protein
MDALLGCPSSTERSRRISTILCLFDILFIVFTFSAFAEVWLLELESHLLLRIYRPDTNNSWLELTSPTLSHYWPSSLSTTNKWNPVIFLAYAPPKTIKSTKQIPPPILLSFLFFSFFRVGAPEKRDQTKAWHHQGTRPPGPLAPEGKRKGPAKATSWKGLHSHLWCPVGRENRNNNNGMSINPERIPVTGHLGFEAA